MLGTIICALVLSLASIGVVLMLVGGADQLRLAVMADRHSAPTVGIL